MPVMSSAVPPANTSPRSTRRRCERPGCRRGAITGGYCRTLCRDVHRVALAVAKRDIPPRGRSLGEDAREVIRLLERLGAHPRGNVLTNAEMNSFIALKHAYVSRST